MCGHVELNAGVQIGVKLAVLDVGKWELASFTARVELGVYVDMYGYCSVRVTDDMYWDFKGTYYFELGIYVELALEFGLFSTYEAEIEIVQGKVPIYTCGAKYVLVESEIGDS